MKKILLVFLVSCGAQMQRPVDLLGKGTVCRSINEGREFCIDDEDTLWDCWFKSGSGWTCKLEGWSSVDLSR